MVLAIGGLLSVSKSFILGGLPVAVLYLLSLRSGRRWLGSPFSWLGIGAGTIFVWFALKAWDGYAYLMRLFRVDASNALRVLTADRIGGESTYIQRMFAEVLAESPLQGFGFGAIQMLDNAYLEFFYSGGVFSLVLHGCVLAVLTTITLKAVCRGCSEAGLLVAFTCLIVGAGLGGPVLTLNRSSIPLWIIVLLTLETVIRQPVETAPCSYGISQRRCSTQVEAY
jgi:hypothetical protein